jgi:DNA-binding PadR family transcriptional regulator
MKMLILGLLMERDRHPYEIRQTIKDRHWDQVFRLRDGSLYYAVDQLRNDGLIEASEVIATPGEHRPDKTVYRITDKGREAFPELLYAQWEHPVFPHHPMFLGLPFAHRADPGRIAEIAESHLAACEARITRIRHALELKSSYLPRGAIHLMRGIIQLSETEREWLTELIADAERGGLQGPAVLPPEA